MQYQLPNGKVIRLSVEEYLSLSDDELLELSRGGFGEEPSYRSLSSSGKKGDIIDTPVDKSLDFIPDSEVVDSTENTDNSEIIS